MLVLGGLLAVIMGVYLICYGVLGYFGNLSNAWLNRGLCVGFGLPALAGGIGCWVWALSGGPALSFPPRYRFEEIDISDLAPLTAAVIVKPKQPGRLVLTEGEIRYRFPFQGWRTREAGELTRVYLDPVHRTVSVRHEGVAVSVEMTHDSLMPQFDDGLELCIDLDRALQFGSSPERLHLVLNHLYPR